MRNISGVTSQERRAAGRLGAVYLEIEKRNVRSLDTWAIPLKKPSALAEYKREFYQALRTAYNFDLERALKARRASRDTLTAAIGERIGLQQQYGSDYFLLVPAIMESAAGFAKKCVDAEVMALSQLLATLSAQSSTAEWLHIASKDILAAAKRALPQQMRKEEAARVGAPEPAPEEETSKEPQKGYPISYLSPYEVKQILRELARGKARYAGDHLIEILMSSLTIRHWSKVLSNYVFNHCYRTHGGSLPRHGENFTPGHGVVRTPACLLPVFLRSIPQQ
jgi:hypothetical protein